MPLTKLYDVYTLDTSCFYNDEELLIDKKLNKAKNILKKIKIRHNEKEADIAKKQGKQKAAEVAKLVSLGYDDYFYERHCKILNNIISDIKKELKQKLSDSQHITRTIRPETLIEKNVVSIFDSDLTRSLNMNEEELNLQLIIVKVFYFDVMKSIVDNGFYLNDKKYVFFSASSGQIRTKKFVAVEEEALLNCFDKLTCGLSLDIINRVGGANTNKYLSNLALCNSATDIWQDFNIDKAIVVEDFESMVNGVVDYIDDITYEITRQNMDVPITHSDGCGLINYGNQNFMVRAPWIKGLLSPFRFHDFIKEHNGNCIVEDIYGEKYDIFKDDIQIIFTKSQFKMWKYYSNWQEYKNNFKKYNCTIGICNKEDEFKNTRLNYQILQTLTDITDKELSYICKTSKNKLNRLSSDVETMLKVFGVHKGNTNKNYFQQSLEIYPELLQEVYTKETLKAIKKSLERKAWSGKLDVYGKYTFIIPDLYAFCEYLFLGNKNPSGLLKNEEVFCKLFKNSEKLDCLRSPHLYREHAVRYNMANKKEEFYNKWLITNGIYTSCHDLISKILQFDKQHCQTL